MRYVCFNCEETHLKEVLLSSDFGCFSNDEESGLLSEAVISRPLSFLPISILLMAESEFLRRSRNNGRSCN